MWNDHLYMDAALYRSEHVGVLSRIQELVLPSTFAALAPYWRVAWQQLTGKTQYEIGTYGMHMRSTSRHDHRTRRMTYTDLALDTQIDRTLFRTDVLSFRGTYIQENNESGCARAVAGAAATGIHHLNTVLANAEYHFGNRVYGHVRLVQYERYHRILAFIRRSPVSGSANGDPRGAGYIANISFWPWQNLQLAAQYTGYTRFNGGITNYDGVGPQCQRQQHHLSGRKIIF